MTRGCYMASIDWKDAYYSVPVAEEFQIYLRFIWRNRLFKFTCLPNGLSSGPRIFTILTKLTYSELWRKGHLNASYFDDSKEILLPIAEQMLLTLFRLAWMLVLWCIQENPILSLVRNWLVWDSFWIPLEWLFTWRQKRQTDWNNHVLPWLKKQTLSIQKLAGVVGQMVASFPGVECAKLYYRLLNNAKTAALAKSKGKFESIMTLSESARSDLHRWIENICSAFKTISLGNSHIVLQSDASNKGWGGTAVLRSTT